MHLLRSEHENKVCVKHGTLYEDCGHLLFAFVSAFVVGKTPVPLNMNTVTDDATTQGVL